MTRSQTRSGSQGCDSLDRRRQRRGLALQTELLEEFHRIRNRHWWYRGRRTVVAAILRRFLSHGVSGPLLDLGSGPATNQSLLTPLASTVVTLDASAHALRWCRHEKYGRPVAGDAQRLPFADRSFAVVAALDILEHLDDDRTAVAEL